jgi:dTMP kinase
MTTPFNGLFITIEGADGAGKSTHMDEIIAHLARVTHREIVRTHEPGGTPLAEQIRTLVKTVDMSPATETLLLNAARSDHLERVILPALSRGAVVVCDRFTDSTRAYQGGVKGFPTSKIIELEDWTLGGLQPDMTLYFDVPLEVSRARRQHRNEGGDRLETEMDANFQALRDAYLHIAQEQPKRVVVIDGTPSVQQVFQQIEVALARWHDFLAEPIDPSSPLKKSQNARRVKP